MNRTIEVLPATAPKRQPYPDYKDSGPPWLGPIPSHWQTRPLKYCGDPLTRGDAPTYVDRSGIKVVNQACIKAGQLDLSFAKYHDPDDVNRLKGWLRPNDVLVNSTGTGTLGRVALFQPPDEDKYIADGHVTIIRVSREHLEPWFLRYYLSVHQETLTELGSQGSTNQIELGRARLGSFPIPFPPLPEQLAIAAFLDRETARIDALIAKKERLIELLQEKRTALISHVVTKGLDPTVPMKDSGVEWLGEIPAHWEAKKIKRLCLVKRGASPRPIDDPIYFDDDGEYAWVRISDVTASSKYLIMTEQRLSLLGQSKSVRLEPGELFLSIAATVGKPIITQVKCCIHDGFVYFVGLKQNREFLFYVFSAGELYEGLGKLGTQLNLNTDIIGDIRIPIPPEEEQQRMAVFLDRQTARIDALVAKVQEGIEKLREYRTALISAAVTGKIDVQGEVT